MLSLSRGTYDPEKYESPCINDGQGTRDVQASSSQHDGVLPGDSIIAVNSCDDSPLNSVKEGQRPREASLPVVEVELGGRYVRSFKTLLWNPLTITSTV